ncbi:DUF1173 domain-containing protein [Burkholderia multivorans]|uniref:DUF1173 domain-containing protein n=2 Tax=Burkholderia multivorans TaxID=87883 RepID=UPI001F14B2B5|nr:DUF1173 domain-containing protein [Burkholderia multivorans]MCA8318082.1 DUF1173 domain-containing protein [Burkholderia multivorans]MCA8488229.1 DUF1173 domain-containing protein [Burkholderia multivorans]MDN7865553.1 DUF1173 domain-containing protein [Burkholderia multivorans]MDN7952828.1 DUF1173 domain-containing protein [Burkholderia multivorans]
MKYGEDMVRFEIDGKNYSEDDPGLQGALARIHGSAIRPLCLCVDPKPGIPMYVSKVHGQYLIKRMPDSGPLHSAEKNCPSYEAPAQLSGLGEVMGHAIKEDVDDGTTSLRLDFALNKIAGRAPPTPTDSEQDSVKGETSKLTIRSLLHYLWDEARLTHWHPGMEGRRSWATVHKYLLRAAQGKFTKGMHLPSTLYVPEPFYVDRKHEIEQRRSALLAAAHKPGRGGQRLFIAIGEIKAVTAARYGHKIELKHAPGFFFMMSADLNKRLKVFEAEKSLWNAYPDIHLIMIATFSVDVAGVAELEEMALMTVNEQWIPFSTVEEKSFLETLVSDRRRFVKGLRYNLPSTRPLASVVLNDTEGKHTAVYMVPGNASEAYKVALAELLADERMNHLQWESGNAMPVLPPPSVRTVSEAA